MILNLCDDFIDNFNATMDIQPFDLRNDTYHSITLMAWNCNCCQVDSMNPCVSLIRFVYFTQRVTEAEMYIVLMLMAFPCPQRSSVFMVT